MKIEVLHFDGCPNHDPTVERVKEALRQEGLSAEIAEINVRDAASAQSLRFLGSPTIRINGVDIEPAARLSKEFGLMCRTYPEGGGRVGGPPLALIRAALREAPARTTPRTDAGNSCDACPVGVSQCRYRLGTTSRRRLAH